jgi:hypothetical protein
VACTRSVLSVRPDFDQLHWPDMAFLLRAALPKTMPRENDWAPWAVTLAFYGSAALFCVVLKSRAQRLTLAAGETEKTLNLQAPLLTQMSAFAAAHGTAQSANIGSVSGTGNMVNATNSITHVLHKADEKKLSEKLWSPLGIAIASALLNKLLHLS